MHPLAAQGAPDVAIAPVTLVLGGARSGKSAFAESQIERHVEQHGGARVYLATAEAGDAEMALESPSGTSEIDRISSA